MQKVPWKAKEAAIRQLEVGGAVDPVALIKAARDPSHPCHNDFTWDVERAAQERWRDQARKLIRQCHFEVVIEDITERVVRYVESPDDEPVFVSLPKMRSAAKTSEVLNAELAQLHGVASRTYGVALAKSGIVGAEMVHELRSIRDRSAALRDSMDE